MARRQRLAQHAALALMGGVVACFVLASAVALALPQRFDSHEATIAYALQQHDIAYTQISLEQNKGDTLSFYSYGRYSAAYAADVTIQLADGGHANGRLQCTVERRTCYLFLRELGTVKELLPELTTDDQRYAWQEWLWQQGERVRARLGLA